MKRTIVTFLSILIVGCSSTKPVVTADIRIQCGTNLVTVSQPKDTIIDAMEFSPATGKLVLKGYQSTANAAAIEASKAQAAAQAESFKQVVAMMQMMAVADGKSQGVDMSGSLPRGITPAPFVVPDGYKLVPKDDPSVPRWIPNTMPYTLPTNSFVVPFEFSPFTSLKTP